MTDPIELPVQERFTRVIGCLGGRHNVRIKEENERYVRIVHFDGLSTFDWDLLTRLVIAAHTYGVRVEITSCNMHYVNIWLHARHKREGTTYERHPTPLDLAKQATEHWQAVVESLEATPKGIDNEGH